MGLMEKTLSVAGIHLGKFVLSGFEKTPKYNTEGAEELFSRNGVFIEKTFREEDLFQYSV